MFSELSVTSCQNIGLMLQDLSFMNQDTLVGYHTGPSLRLQPGLEESRD